MALHIDGLQRATVFDKRHRLAVGTELWQERSPVALHELLLRKVSGIGKEFFLVILDLCPIHLPKSVALRSVDERTSVGGKTDVAFLLGGICNLFCRLIVCGGNEDIAMIDKGYLLARR